MPDKLQSRKKKFFQFALVSLITDSINIFKIKNENQKYSKSYSEP